MILLGDDFPVSVCVYKNINSNSMWRKYIKTFQPSQRISVFVRAHAYW